MRLTQEKINLLKNDYLTYAKQMIQTTFQVQQLQTMILYASTCFDVNVPQEYSVGNISGIGIYETFVLFLFHFSF